MFLTLLIRTSLGNNYETVKDEWLVSGNKWLKQANWSASGTQEYASMSYHSKTHQRSSPFLPE